VLLGVVDGELLVAEGVLLGVVEGELLVLLVDEELGVLLGVEEGELLVEDGVVLGVVDEELVFGGVLLGVEDVLEGEEEIVGEGEDEPQTTLPK